MKTKRNWAAALSAVALLAALGACQNPIALLKGTDSAAASKKGVVSLRIRPLSPIVVDALGGVAVSAPARTAASPAAAPRAYLSAAKIRVSLTGPGTLTWEEYPNTDLITNGFVNDTTAFYTSERSVSPGVYSAMVFVYNSATDASPVVYGSSKSFEVVANETTPVSVACIPVDPISLEKDVASAEMELAKPWEITEDDGEVSSVAAGSEQWYQIWAEDSWFGTVTVSPTDGSEALLVVTVFDPEGHGVEFYAADAPGEAVSVDFGPTTAGSYYIAVVCAELDGVPSNGPFTVLVEDGSPPPPPVASFVAAAAGGGTPGGDAPLTVEFNDRSAGWVDSWAWDFQNDGTIDSTEQNPTFLYEEPTRYSVALTVSGPGGTDTVVQQGLVAAYLPDASYLVDANGGDDANPGTKALPFKTITKAVATAGKEATIQVFPGTYDAALGERFPISLQAGQSLVGDVANRGDGPTPTLLLGHGAARVGYSTIVAADTSRLAGLEFGDTATTEQAFAVTIVDAQATIESNSFGAKLYGGVYLEASGISTIEQNTFQTDYYGTYLSNTTGAIVIDGNEFLTGGARVDVNVSEGDSPEVTNNTFTGNGASAISVQNGAPFISANIFQNPGGYPDGAVTCQFDDANPILRDNQFVCGIAVGIGKDHAANPDCGTSRVPGNNDFSGVTGSAINMEPGTTADIQAYGNTWPHDPPTTGTSGSYDIVVQGTGSVTWDSDKIFPPPQ